MLLWTLCNLDNFFQADNEDVYFRNEPKKSWYGSHPSLTFIEIDSFYFDE